MNENGRNESFKVRATMNPRPMKISRYLAVCCFSTREGPTMGGASPARQHPGWIRPRGSVHHISILSFSPSPSTHMKGLLKRIQGKNSPKPPLQPNPPGNPAGTAAGSPGSNVGLDMIPEGGYTVDCPDPTTEQGGGGGGSPQIAFLARMDGDQEHRASEASTPGPAFGGTHHGYKPRATGECN